jgi:putative ATP-binding cassette transporter
MAQINFLFHLIRLAGAERRKLFWASFAAGTLQGILLYVMSSCIEELAGGAGISFRNFLLFVLCLVGLYKFLLISMSISSAVARDLITGYEVRISEKISQTSYVHFNSLDRGAIYDAITGSKDIINESAIMLPIFISSLTMLACCLVFSLFISVAGLVAVLLVMGLAALLFFHSDKNFIRALMAYRASATEFQGTLKDVILGFNELKMNEDRRKALFEKQITPFSQKVIARRVDADKHRVQNTVMYGLMVYFPVGALLFVLPQTGLVTLEQCVKIVAITLFSTIPLIGLLSFMPLASRGAFIVDGLETFERSLDKMRDAPVDLARPLAEFQSIAIADAGYEYAKPEGGIQPFSLSVKEFTLNRGELVILRGGNGSGKSTFMRILAGLEPFTQGDILLNGESAACMGAARYRAYFSVLFPDFHIFTGLYGLNADPERVRALLRRMALSEKVRYDEETQLFSSNSLSSGQRKRLALVCSILEDRPIMLFDEVAADFDHHFREVFYNELLPEFKAEGRTVLAISHDDRYFAAADRVLTMRYGKFLDDDE